MSLCMFVYVGYCYNVIDYKNIQYKGNVDKMFLTFKKKKKNWPIVFSCIPQELYVSAEEVVANKRKSNPMQTGVTFKVLSNVEIILS